MDRRAKRPPPIDRRCPTPSESDPLCCATLLCSSAAPPSVVPHPSPLTRCVHLPGSSRHRLAGVCHLLGLGDAFDLLALRSVAAAPSSHSLLTPRSALPVLFSYPVPCLFFPRPSPSAHPSASSRRAEPRQAGPVCRAAHPVRQLRVPLACKVTAAPHALHQRRHQPPSSPCARSFPHTKLLPRSGAAGRVGRGSRMCSTSGTTASCCRSASASASPPTR